MCTYFQEEREGPFLLLFVSCFAGNQVFSCLATDLIQCLLVKDESKRPEGTQKMGRKTAVCLEDPQKRAHQLCDASSVWRNRQWPPVTNNQSGSLQWSHFQPLFTL